MSSNVKASIPKEFLNPSGEFSRAMQSMDIHWWYWDTNSKQLILSPHLIALLGYKPEEYDPSIPTLDRNIHPDDIVENREVFKNFLQGNLDVYEMEYRLNVNDKYEWYYNRGTPIIKDDEGKVLFAGGITLNISNRFNRLLSKVEESSKFEFIFKSTTESVLVVKIGEQPEDSKIIDANQAAGDLFACSRDELVGMNPFQMLDDNILEERDKLRAELISKGTLGLELMIKDLEGVEKYVEVKALVFTETGDQLFIAIISDKTETYKVKKELKASALALRQSERIYRSLVQAAEDRIGLFKTDGNPVLLNQAFYEMLGFDHDEFMGLEDNQRVHPEDKKRLSSLRNKLFNEGSLSSEYRVMHKDGHYLHMSSKSMLLKDSDLDEDYILLIIRDITERVESQKELLQAKEMAIESDKLKSAFLANMSHEIRTPMNSIVGFANLLVEEELDDESRREYVRRINRNSEQLLTLISDIIDLAKIESNQLSVSYTKVIIYNLFCELTAYAKNLLKERNQDKVEIICEADRELNELTIESDLIRITQIMQNLINNAIKFTSEGKVTIGYKLSGKEHVLLYVQDTGFGIDRKNFDIIFDQFRQVDGSNVRKYGGTGLGLAICKNLTELLGGRIWVESEKGKGAAFYVEIPLKSGYIIEDEIPSDDPGSDVISKLSVLIVDDDPDSIMLLVTLLRNKGIQSITADSGYRALEILEREDPPDIILLDLQMPVLDGVQTMKIMREKYPDLKIIAQSAHALEGERDRTISKGFDEYISKPYRKDALLEIIKKVADS